MTARNIHRSYSLDFVWEELTYTEARLLSDSNAADLAPQMSPLFAELETVRKGQLGGWREEIVAQAKVDALNDRLDDLVVDLADTLLFTERDRKSPRFQRYFQKTPHAIVRCALAAEVEAVRGWPESLRTEPEDAIKAFAPRFDEILKQAKDALDGRTRAGAARADYRVRQIEPFIDKVNEKRNALFGELAKRAAERKLAKSWPEGFFRVAARREAEPATP